MNSNPFNSQKKPNHESFGFSVERLHSGQKRAYGDSYYEYRIISKKPEDEVLDYCTNHVQKCSLSYEDWLAENRAKPSMDKHFRHHYKFKKTGEFEYFYQIISLYTD